MYIANQEMLEDFVQRARSSRVLAIDTEFLREKTYYARLCLLQLATDNETVVVDPFAVKDLHALAPLFEDPSIMKLFHAATQDIEIIHHELGIVPCPIFDTQVAAALLGHTQQIGYASLVHAECGVQLKKIESFTDWSRRPLSDSQLKYAADDVIYLPDLYFKMTDSLKKKGRLHWLDDDFARLSDPAHYEVDSRERFRRLKRASQLSRKQLAAAREVAAWREEEARRRDIPRKWVVTDEQIVEACKREAKTVDDLFMVRGLKDRIGTREAREIVALIAQGIKSPKDTWPDLDRGKKNEPNVDVELDLMSALVRISSKKYGVAFQTLAPHDDLARLARGYKKDVALLSGWRKALVGDELVKLLSGEISLSFEDGALKVTETSQRPSKNDE